MTDRNISDLCPEIQALMPQFIEKCASSGITVRPIVTWRSATDQNVCKASGLSNALAGQSPHNYVNPQGSLCSLAFDFGVFDRGTYISDGTDARYAQAGAIGKGLGLEYGGDWLKPDWDHLQIANWKNYGT